MNIVNFTINTHEDIERVFANSPQHIQALRLLISEKSPVLLTITHDDIDDQISYNIRRIIPLSSEELEAEALESLKRYMDNTRLTVNKENPGYEIAPYGDEEFTDPDGNIRPDYRIMYEGMLQMVTIANEHGQHYSSQFLASISLQSQGTNVENFFDLEVMKKKMQDPSFIQYLNENPQNASFGMQKAMAVNPQFESEFMNFNKEAINIIEAKVGRPMFFVYSSAISGVDNEILAPTRVAIKEEVVATSTRARLQ